MGPGRVIEAHCEVKWDAGPTQMTPTSGDSGTLQFMRTSAEHVEAGQSADKCPSVKRLQPVIDPQDSLAEWLKTRSGAYFPRSRPIQGVPVGGVFVGVPACDDAGAEHVVGVACEPVAGVGVEG